MRGGEKSGAASQSLSPKTGSEKTKVQLVNVHYGTYAGRVLATAQMKNGDSLSAALLAEDLAKPYRGRRAQWCA